MSILVDLISCFKDKPENVATRALHTLLKKSECLSGLQELLKSRLNWDRQITAINAQVNQGVNGQPDLEGLGGSGDKLFFCEVKFWAGLTENQPLGYLDELAPGGLLLFMVPKSRRLSVWTELQRRVHDRFGPVTDVGSFQLRVNNRCLALLSGPDVLDYLLDVSKRSGSNETSGDILQLSALWRAYDVPDLPPMTEELLTSSLVPQIISGLSDLPKKITLAAIEVLNAKTWGQPKQGTTPYSNIELGKLKGWVVFSQKNWRAYEGSPIWFETHRTQNPDFSDWGVVERVFAERAGRIQPLLSEEYKGGCISVPLRVRANATESDVIDDIIDELRSLAHRIEGVSTPATAA